MAIHTISVTRTKAVTERSKQILHLQAYQSNSQETLPLQDQKEERGQAHLPSEILLEVFQHCAWQDRFALSQVCQRWRALSHKVLFPKVFNQSFKSLQNFPPSTFTTHVAFSSLRLVRGDENTALQSYILLPTCEQMSGFPLERRLCECPIRNDPATHPPLTELKLRFQYQPLLKSLISLNEMKPTPTYRFKGEKKKNGEFVTVADVCGCICDCLNNDRYLKE